jgi:restriction endonuclease Mrr
MTLDRKLLVIEILRALASGGVRNFRDIHKDVKWKLGLSAEEVERLHPSGRTEVSYHLSEALQRMIADGYVTTLTRAHYCITPAGRDWLSGFQPPAA